MKLSDSDLFRIRAAAMPPADILPERDLMDDEPTSNTNTGDNT